MIGSVEKVVDTKRGNFRQPLFERWGGREYMTLQRVFQTKTFLASTLWRRVSIRKEVIKIAKISNKKKTLIEFGKKKESSRI